MSELINKLIEWEAVKAQLDAIKKQESDLRIEICEQLLDGKSAGSHTTQYTYNDKVFKTTAEKVLNYKLDQKEIASMMEYGMLTGAEEDCIRVKYELDLRNYKKLDSSQRKAIDEHLIVSDGMPQLKIKWSD
jgi:hypothetical protein